MKYCSTRNNSLRVDSSTAIAQGISTEGGLFVPVEFPTISYDELCSMQNDDYKTRAEKIMSKFLTDFSKEEVRECVENAYTSEKFGSDTIAPLHLLNNSTYILELWHGPTCAFKDMALQILPHLLTKSAKKTADGKTVVILVATSGDTGKAALEGFKDVENTKILVFYPEDGVSNVQKMQMQTQEGDNVSVCAIYGNFDDAQTGVKQIFTDKEFAQKLTDNNMQFSSANSINWGRLLPQIVYYFSSYCDIMATGEMDHKGEKVNIVVPTGNFGNILAAYYAKKMGLPVNKFICASNPNNVLTDFLKDGVYDKNRPFHATISPSMDILISSNLERLLFDMYDGDSDKIADLMGQLNKNGKYCVSDDVKAKINELFFADFATDDETKKTIKDMFDWEKYLLDTHTAVAYNVYEKYKKATDDLTPVIIASTASPFKFADSVLEAVSGEDMNIGDFEKVQTLAQLTGAIVPEQILALQNKEVRFNHAISKEDMTVAVTDMLSLK